MAEPQSAIQTIGMSYEGRPVLMTDILAAEADTKLPPPGKVTGVNPSGVLAYQPPRPKNYTLEQEQMSEDGTFREVDYQDLLQLNFEILSCMKRLHAVRNDLQTAERAVVKARIAYDQTLRREILKTTGATEKVRQAWAEVQCEDLYKEYQVAIQISRELQQFSKDVRVELDALKEVSNNLRRQNAIESQM